MDHLAHSRFPAVAGWQKSYGDIFAVLNQVTYQIFSQCQKDGQEARPLNERWYGMDGKGFGWGTVHHAAGSLRMPHRTRYDGPIESESVKLQGKDLATGNKNYIQHEYHIYLFSDRNY